MGAQCRVTKAVATKIVGFLFIVHINCWYADDKQKSLFLCNEAKDWLFRDVRSPLVTFKWDVVCYLFA